MGRSIYRFVEEVFEGYTNNRVVNQTFLVLVPKVQNMEYFSSFKPIGLCNTTYKVVTKVIVDRIKEVLPRLISPNQSSFIPYRSIQNK